MGRCIHLACLDFRKTQCDSLPFPRLADILPVSSHKEEHPDAGWSSPVAREAHNLEVVGSNPAPATYTKGRCLRTSAFLRSIAQIGNAWRMNQRCWQPLWHRVAPRSLRLAPPRESAFPGGGPAPGRSRPKLSAFLESRYVCEIRGRFVLIAERTGPSSAGA